MAKKGTMEELAMAFAGSNRGTNGNSYLSTTEGSIKITTKAMTDSAPKPSQESNRILTPDIGCE
jgi:hypothetical protein